MNNNKSHSNNFAKKILIATPGAMHDTIFSQSLVYIITHDAYGAIGFIFNHVLNKRTLENIGALMETEAQGLDIHIGGPHQLKKTFVVHDAKYTKPRPIFNTKNKNIVISDYNTDIINDIANDNGPESYLICSGNIIWQKNELEQEIEDNLWIDIDYDHDLLFNTHEDDDSNQWIRAIKKANIDLNSFVTTNLIKS